MAPGESGGGNSRACDGLSYCEKRRKLFPVREMRLHESETSFLCSALFLESVMRRSRK